MMKVVSVLAAIVALGSAIPAPDESLNTCELCVGAGKAWNGGECLDSCMIMDVGCYEDTKGCDAYNEMQLMIRECPQQGSCKGCLSHNRFCKFGKNDGKCAMRDGFYDWSAYVQESTDCDCLCPKNLDPVCGSDGVTYGNACEAACAEVSTTDGACVVEEACSCAEIWSPVCADGKTYGNECEAKCANVETFTQGECPKPVCVLKNGTKIPQGDSWKASDCEHCQCFSSDTGPKIECYMQDCAPPQECEDGFENQKVEGQCCHQCQESDCDGTVVACLVRPCSVTTCDAHPDAVCADDYCDGCNAIFTLDGEVLSKDECEKEKPEFDCQTRELWTNEKQVWCCENEERGCDGVCETSDGDMYALGASWQPDACTYCSCDDPGTAKQGICAVMDCMPPLCGLDEEMVTQEGKCCPTCVKKVVESSECPANCGDGTCKGDQCTSCGTQNKAIAKGTDADGFFGKCLNTLYCDSNKIVQNTANAGKPCKCSLNKCQYCVTNGAEQEVCKKCQSGFYLLDGECVESCSDEHAAVGINEVGRKCMEPFSCVKGRMVGGGGGKCKCATPDNGFHRTCHACTFQAGGIGDVCTKCKSGKFLNPATAQCQDACDGLAGLIHYGDNELGNECRKPFTCANGLDEDSRKCKCSSASGGRKCASCEWGADGDTCTLCKLGAYLHNGVCVKQCPQGTTEVGTKTVGRVCE